MIRNKYLCTYVSNLIYLRKAVTMYWQIVNETKMIFWWCICNVYSQLNGIYAFLLIKNHMVHEVRLDFLRWFLRWFWPVFIQNGFRHLKDELSCLVNHWITWLLSSLWDVKNCSHHSHTKSIFIQINGCQRQYFIVKISSQILHSKYWIYWINHLCIYDNTIYHCYEEEMNKADHVISNYSTYD